MTRLQKEGSAMEEYEQLMKKFDLHCATLMALRVEAPSLEDERRKMRQQQLDYLD